MAFMPFITAGDPDLAMTKRLIGELAACGVDLIEIGFPYSDPIADGPVIQASYTRALGRHLHVHEIFSAVKEVTGGKSAIGGDKEQGKSAAVPRSSAESSPTPVTVSPVPPLIAMVAYAIIFRIGNEAFVGAARDAGFAGLIVPDLPADEADDLAGLCGKNGLELIPLIAPTTTSDRTRRIIATARGFIYCIAVAGTTGVRDQLPPELSQQLQWLKSQTELPLAVGFGINRPAQVDELRGLADGVIVGSAIVKQVAAISTDGLAPDQSLANVATLARAMVAATHRTK
ncbi:MAG: tryptophan synthase subunit alpha [Planctomycetaceae bacterium]|nr:tryptophan synthase subunit alpha [Planctomycetaceae bacterium]